MQVLPTATKLTSVWQRISSSSDTHTRNSSDKLLRSSVALQNFQRTRSPCLLGMQHSRLLSVTSVKIVDRALHFPLDIKEYCFHVITHSFVCIHLAMLLNTKVRRQES